MKKIIILFFLLCSFLELKAQYKVQETFEGTTFPPSGWTTKSPVPSYPWIRTTACSGFGTSTASAKYNFFSNSSGTIDSLVTPLFSATVAGDSIKFDQAHAAYGTENDSLVIMYSLDGFTFQRLIALAGQATVGGLSTAPATNSAFVPTAAQWVVRSYAAPLGTVKIKFYIYSDFGNNLYIDNVIIGSPPAFDVQALSVGSTGVQYYGSTTITPSGIVQNNGSSTATFTVTRTINPGGYISTKTVSALNAGNSQTVNFDNWVFTSGNTYTVKDSVYLVGDVNPSNDTLSGSITPNIPKDICIINADNASRDSLIAHMTLAGINSSYYDVLTSVPSLRLWRTVFVLMPGGTWSAALRDSMKAFMDNANDPVNKKSLLIFGNDLGYSNDPKRNTSALPADTLFYRQYLRAVYDADSWLTILGSTKKYKGIISPFTAITADSCNDPYPDAVTPAVWYGGQAALIPTGESGDGDTCNAVVYSGTYYNMFYGTNIYARYMPTTSATLAPQGMIFNMIRAYIESNNGQLPVELASFSSSVNNRNVTLNWATASEENNAGFNIERKLAGETSWRTLATVNGAGNSNAVKNYSYTDNNVNTGKYNYRLKQVDFNGNFKYYNLSNEVIIGVPNKFALSQNYPNPFNPTTNINYDLPFDSKVMIKIFDITGREVASLVNQVQAAGYYSVNFNASVLSSGVYFYSITADGGNRSFAKTLKMMLVK